MGHQAMHIIWLLHFCKFNLLQLIQYRNTPNKSQAFRCLKQALRRISMLDIAWLWLKRIILRCSIKGTCHQTRFVFPIIVLVIGSHFSGEGMMVHGSDIGVFKAQTLQDTEMFGTFWPSFKPHNIWARNLRPQDTAYLVVTFVCLLRLSSKDHSLHCFQWSLIDHGFLSTCDTCVSQACLSL